MNKDFDSWNALKKRLNVSSNLILPITTKEKNDPFHYKILANNKTVWVKLSQVKVISSKRLLRKIGVLEETQFKKLKAAWKNTI